MGDVLEALEHAVDGMCEKRVVLEMQGATATYGNEHLLVDAGPASRAFDVRAALSAHIALRVRPPSINLARLDNLVFFLDEMKDAAVVERFVIQAEIDASPDPEEMPSS